MATTPRAISWSSGAGKIKEYVAPPPPLSRAQARAAAQLERAKRVEEAAQAAQKIAELEQKLQLVRAQKFTQITSRLTYSPERPRPEDSVKPLRRRRRR